MSQQLAGKGAPVGGWKGEGQDLTWECGDKCREQFLRLTVDDWVWGDSHWFHGHCGLIQMWNPPYQAISRSSSGDACHHFRWWTWVWFGILFATLHGFVRNFQSPKSSGFRLPFWVYICPMFRDILILDSWLFSIRFLSYPYNNVAALGQTNMDVENHY